MSLHCAQLLCILTKNSLYLLFGAAIWNSPYELRFLACKIRNISRSVGCLRTCERDPYQIPVQKCYSERSLKDSNSNVPVWDRCPDETMTWYQLVDLREAEREEIVIRQCYRSQLGGDKQSSLCLLDHTSFQSLKSSTKHLKMYPLNFNLCSASLVQMRTIIYRSSQKQSCENKIINIHETFIYLYQGLEMWNKWDMMSCTE